MTHFTQKPLAYALATALVALSACSVDQTPTDKKLAAPQIKLETQLSSQTVAEADLSSVVLSGVATLSSQNTPMVKTRHQLLQVADIQPAPYAGENYAEYSDNNTHRTSTNRVSTFSIDVDTGAYSNMRRVLQSGSLPTANAIRVEELINYFSYDYDDEQTQNQPFTVNTELARSPWNDNTHLLQISLAGFTPNELEKKAANLVFLIDVSGSMNAPNKLGLLKSSISLLSNQLNAADMVSIVVYAGSSGTVLEPTSGDQKRAIHQALARLSAGGATHGAAGIELAYDIAAENFITDGTNRIILATDGDFNVGISDVKKLKELIASKRKSGIALTTLGFGSGNYNDHLMEQLAQEGNGNYAYIDTLSEARKVLVDELDASLLTIAEDVKIQVEFNPSTVSEYRLIGYTNRLLADEAFDNDLVDAGEIGAGHTVTALYEISLTGQGGERHTANRYEPTINSTDRSTLDEIAQVRLRYKLPSQTQSLLLTNIVSKKEIKNDFETASENFRFATSVAAFGQLLRGSQYINDFNFKDARGIAQRAIGTDTYAYRQEFLRLIDIANSLHQIERATLSSQRFPDRG